MWNLISVYREKRSLQSQPIHRFVMPVNFSTTVTCRIFHRLTTVLQTAILTGIVSHSVVHYPRFVALHCNADNALIAEGEQNYA
jgi:hypothetical protein